MLMITTGCKMPSIRQIRKDKTETLPILLSVC